MKHMFQTQTSWLQTSCYYVAASTFSKMAFLAGPYPTRQKAETVFDTAREWAIKSSGDTGAASYTYFVHESHDGYIHSILGELSPLKNGGFACFDAYEISPCRCYQDDDNPAHSYYEICEPEEADVWTLYGHIPGQGVDAIGDFATCEHAEEVYYRITGKYYGK